MTDVSLERRFQPGAPDSAGVISWVHIGDLQMTEALEKNHVDLVSIVDEINRVVTGSIAFAYLPGDIADHGTAAAYAGVERADRDQDNAVGAWPERGLVGTQLGPNKNGRKW